MGPATGSLSLRQGRTISCWKIVLRKFPSAQHVYQAGGVDAASGPGQRSRLWGSESGVMGKPQAALVLILEE